MNRFKIIFLVTFLIISFKGYSQEESREMILVELDLYCSNFEKSKELINTFLAEKDAIISKTVEKENSFYSNFFISETNKTEFDALVDELGYVYYKKESVLENKTKIQESELELEFLRNKKLEYEKEINSTTDKSEKYYNYWEELRRIENQIFEIEKKLLGYEMKSNFQIIINLYDDSVDLTDRKVNWVNMPGAAFDFLMIENPISSVSGEYYMGYSLKYMITKGKSYFNLGNLKEFDATTTDSLRYTEFFHFGFGQDFYTKHFGRGKRMWFNLYTGYNVGGMFATNSISGRFVSYTKVFLGVELFKNRYFLIDNKIGYFVPFAENKNLRGLEYSFSFNFVF